MADVYCHVGYIESMHRQIKDIEKYITKPRIPVCVTCISNLSELHHAVNTLTMHLFFLTNFSLFLKIALMPLKLQAMILFFQQQLNNIANFDLQS